MSTSTTTLNLTKPEYTDNIDVSVLNTNFDVIDSAIHALQIGMTSNTDKIVSFVNNLSGTGGTYYRCWDSGIMECFGRGEWDNNSGTMTVTYPRTFVTLKPIVQVTLETTGAPDVFVGSVYDSSVSSFIISCTRVDDKTGDITALIYNYHAIGRWK